MGLLDTSGLLLPLLAPLALPALGVPVPLHVRGDPALSDDAPSAAVQAGSRGARRRPVSRPERPSRMQRWGR